MELNITRFYHHANTLHYQNSIAKSGLLNIGEITWNRAKRDSVKYPFATKENRDRLINWLADFGAWAREEMVEWTLMELKALMIQFVASWIQDKGERTWKEYEKASEKGEIGGELFEYNGEVFASIDC